GRHLRSEAAVAGWKLVERPAWNLHDAVVESRLECREGAAGDPVSDLLEAPANGPLRGHPRNRISRRLGGERGGAADARVDLDDVVVGALRVERELHVAPAL